MRTKQSLATKVTYWLKVVSLGMVLGLGLQFAQAWVAPAGAPPAGNVAGPLTTGSSQTKVGALTTGGLAAPSFVDTDNAARYVNPSGTSVLWGLSIASLPNCDLKTNASGAVTCGVDATGGGSGDNLGNHTATQNLVMSSFKITNVANPTSAQDAATKAYVDGVAGLLSGFSSIVGNFGSDIYGGSSVVRSSSYGSLNMTGTDTCDGDKGSLSSGSTCGGGGYGDLHVTSVGQYSCGTSESKTCTDLYLKAQPDAYGCAGVQLMSRSIVCKKETGLFKVE